MPVMTRRYWTQQPGLPGQQSLTQSDVGRSALELRISMALISIDPKMTRRLRVTFRTAVV
jgi:hypothetical protein